jgi:hypothetical protein
MILNTLGSWVTPKKQRSWVDMGAIRTPLAEIKGVLHPLSHPDEEPST